MTPVVCPDCDASDTEPIGPPGGANEVEHGSRTFRQPEFRVWRCRACGLSFKDATLCDDELAAYYRVVNFWKWESERPFPTEREVAHLLAKLPHGASILDYGCGTGRLLSTLTKDYACFGYEVNSDSAKVAADRGLAMLDEPRLSTRGAVYDALVLLDVFEHLRRPSARLAELLELVKPGGLLIAATGNADAPALREHPSDFYYFRNIEHLCGLNHEYAERLCQRLPLGLEHWKELSHYDTPLQQRYRQHLRHFAYWQSRDRTPIARWLLPFLPMTRHAHEWTEPPELSCTRDHVVVAWRRSAA